MRRLRRPTWLRSAKILRRPTWLRSAKMPHLPRQTQNPGRSPLRSQIQNRSVRQTNLDQSEPEHGLLGGLQQVPQAHQPRVEIVDLAQHHPALLRQRHGQQLGTTHRPANGPASDQQAWPELHTLQPDAQLVQPWRPRTDASPPARRRLPRW